MNKSGLLSWLLVLALTGASHPLGAAEFVVNNTGSDLDGCDEIDNGDPEAVCDTGTCANPTNQCSIHAAIGSANENPGTDTITFTVPAITLSSSLPLILDPVVIDGSGGGPRVDLNGNGVNSGLWLDTEAAGSSLTNLVIRNMSGNGIDITTGVGAYLIENNYIGTNVAGSAASANGGDGISVSSPAGPTPPPGLTTIHNNVISGNDGDGIDIFGPNTTGVTVTGNFIGVDSNGLTAVPNGASGGTDHGIRISADAFGILIGGPSVALANVIAGNDASIFSQGISVSGDVDLPITITGNFIGLTPALVLDLGNGNAGIHASDLRPSADNPTEVSLLLGPGNVIGYNGSDTDPADGILLTGSTTGAYVFTNAVGVAEAGSFIDLGNSGNGIVVTGPDNFIGVDDLGVAGGNFVGANGGNGIEIRGSGATGNLVVGNFVGDPDSGDVFAMGNDGDGIRITNAPNNQVGGPSDDETNTIRGNGGNGIRVEGGSAIGNQLIRNSIDENGLLGIDLDFFVAPGMVDPIDPSDPNNGTGNRGLNAPRLFQATYSGGSGATTIEWELETIPSTDGFIIEFYSSPAADPSGSGEGLTYLGEVSGISTDAAGFATGTAPVTPSSPSNTSGQQISAIARATYDVDGSPANDTSEFSSTVLVKTFSVGDVSAQEGNVGTTSFQFEVSRTDTTGTASVSIASSAGTATSGIDYQELAPQQVDFADGVATVPVIVTVFGDTMREPDETFLVVLTNPSAGWGIDDAEGTGTILNDDPIPTISIGDVSGLEGDAGFTLFDFSVTLTNASSEATLVVFSTANGSATAGSDYTPLASTLEIPPGDISGVISIEVLGDTEVELDETFFVNLSPIAGNVGDGQGLGTIQNDDGVSEFSIDDVSQAEGNAGTTNFVFTISRTTTDDTASVQVSSSDGTATQPGDYQELALTTVSFAIGEATRPVLVEVLGDTTFEPNETFFLTLSNPSGGYDLGDDTGQGGIQNDDPEPSVSIGDVTLAEGNAGTTTFTFPVTLSNPSSLAVEVDFQSFDGSATQPSDYTPVLGTALIPAGQVATSIDVLVAGDLDEELDETFTVVLSGPSNTTIGDGEGLGTIDNDDGVRLFSIDDVELAEGNAATTAFVFTITRTATDDVASVTVGTANGSATEPQDYAAIAGQLVTFQIGEATQPVTVLVVGETLHEGDETFVAMLSAPSAGYGVGDGSGLGTILNDDVPPALSITNLSVDEGSGGGFTNFVFDVTLDAPSGLPVSASWSTSDGSATAPGDYAEVLAGSVDLPAGTTNTTATVVVVADDTPELNETFAVTLSGPSGASIANGVATGTILDDDSGPTFSIDDVSELEGSGSGTTTFSFTVSRTSSVGVASVDASTVDGSAVAPGDFAALTGTPVSFLDGESTRLVVVDVVADNTFEGDETFTIELSNPSAGYELADPIGLATIENDDSQPAISIADVAQLEGDVGSSAFGFAVTLSNPSSLTVSVDFQTVDGSAASPGDFTAAAGTATIPAGDLSTTIDVTVLGDLDIEVNEVFTVELANPSGASITDGSATGTILDDDGAPGFSIDDVSQPEGSGGAATGFVFTVTRSSAVAASTVEVSTLIGSATSPADFTALANQAVSFPDGVTSQEVIVTVVPDLIFEGEETFTVELTNPSPGWVLADPIGLGTIQDDDLQPAVSIGDFSGPSGLSGTTAFTFTLALANPSAFPVSLDWTTLDGTAVSPDDFLADGGTLVFAPGQTSATIDILVYGDDLAEGPETFTVELSNVVGGTFTNSQGVGTILDGALGDPNPIEIPTLDSVALILLVLLLALVGAARIRRALPARVIARCHAVATKAPCAQTSLTSSHGGGSDALSGTSCDLPPHCDARAAPLDAR